MAAEARYRFSSRAMVPRHGLAPFLGIQLRGDGGGPGQIAEQHRQMAPLAGNLGRCLRLRSVNASIKRSAALTAELLLRLIRCAALSAFDRQCSATFGAEPAPLAVIISAFAAAHFLRSKFLEQRLGVLEVGGVEAFGEPVVDFRQHRAGLVALALLVEQSCEACCCA
jgi:hypothetical protein